jgi:hypothetical protein
MEMPLNGPSQVGLHWVGLHWESPWEVAREVPSEGPNWAMSCPPGAFLAGEEAKEADSPLVPVLIIDMLLEQLPLYNLDSTEIVSFPESVNSSVAALPGHDSWCSNFFWKMLRITPCAAG